MLVLFPLPASAEIKAIGMMTIFSTRKLSAMQMALIGPMTAETTG